MHHSGTSCVSHLLTKLGVYFGDPPISPGAGEQNRKGFFERRDLRDICDALLQSAGCDWWAVSDFSPDRVAASIRAEASGKFADIVGELDQHGPWFIKEPRLCLVWPLLQTQVSDPVFVHVWRDPIEVARSLATHHGFPIDFGIALWEAYVRSAHRVSQERPSVIVHYNELVNDPPGAARRLINDLGAVGVSDIFMPQHEELADAVDPELYHQRRTSSELEELLTPSQRQLVAALVERRLDDPTLTAALSPQARIRIEDWAETETLRRKFDAYIEELKNRIGVAGEQIARTFNAANRDASLDVERAPMLRRLEGVSRLKTFAAGVRATLNVQQSVAPRWRSLYLHYRLIQRRKDADDLASLATSGWFDPAWYLQQNASVASSGIDPLLHYVDFGAAEGRDPSAYFHTAYYLQMNPDVADSGVNPLLHFIEHGRDEGRLPRPAVKPESILRALTLPPRPARRINTGSLQRAPRRIVIYTAVAGGYDNLQPPLVRPPNCDFVAFSDQPLQVDGWQIRPFNYLHHDPTRSARFVKLHPHVYFADYDHSIWVDGNIGIRGDIREFCARLTDESPLGIFVHPLRDCVYVEANECIKRNKDHAQIITRQVERYRESGFPKKAGMWETNVLARRHNDPACVALMTAWWREMEIGSRRDQLSLPIVVKQLGAVIAPLSDRGEDARNHPLITLTRHPAERRTAAAGAPLPAAIRRTVDIDQIAMDIGVCVHNSPDETKACLDSVIAARRPQDRLVIVDDASDAPTATLLDHFAENHQGIVLIRHEQNLGYTRSANAVLKNAKAPWIVLLNSDAVVPSAALRKLVICGEQFPKLAVVGPLSNAAGWQTVPELTGANGKFLVNAIPAPLTVEDMDRICEEVSDGVVPFVPLINGFCFAIRRSVLSELGLFDEASFPIGYGEEDDFCLRVGAAGLLCSIATDAYVWHAKSASFTPTGRLPLVEAGGKALRAKHSAERVAAAVEMMRRHPLLARLRPRIGEAVRALSQVKSSLRCDDDTQAVSGPAGGETRAQAPIG